MKNMHRVIVKMPCIVLCCAMICLLFGAARIQLQKICELSEQQGRQYENSLRLYMSRIYDSANSLDEDGTLLETLHPMNYAEIEKRIDTFKTVSKNIIKDTAVVDGEGTIYTGVGRSEIRDSGKYKELFLYDQTQVVCMEIEGQYGIIYIRPVFQDGQKRCVMLHLLQSDTFFDNIKQNPLYPMMGKLFTDQFSWSFLEQNMRFLYLIRYPIYLENCNFSIVISNSVESVFRVVIRLGLLFAVILAAVWSMASFAARCAEESVGMPLQKINREIGQYAENAERMRGNDDE